MVTTRTRAVLALAATNCAIAVALLWPTSTIAPTAPAISTDELQPAGTGSAAATTGAAASMTTSAPTADESTRTLVANNELRAAIASYNAALDAYLAEFGKPAMPSSTALLGELLRPGAQASGWSGSTRPTIRFADSRAEGVRVTIGHFAR